ncbi:hypothetical protein FC093_05465 [Ilyomonas limi]|uniref:Uncharacterized protein n=1 Tax=Ilyomonas limi TaxID=2575867 RepID=A0A4U3L6X9_9BACT|nr:hypothetical protein [Ilyomonas limi]TKK70199.1 hypothetical protein FC093_05465 [Ilyomonas limi]
MKRVAFGIILITFACNKPPMPAPATPQTVWIDAATHSDTIITNVGNQYPVLYYASKNWQQSVDTNLSQGFRFIAIRFGDSILVKQLNDTSTGYDGPFLLAVNAENDTLMAQNFIDTASVNPARTFIPFH